MTSDKPPYQFTYRSTRQEKHQQAARLRKSMSDPLGIQSILPSLERQLGLEQKVVELSVFALWNTIVPEAFAGATHPKRLLKQESGQYILEIKTDHSTIANELSFASAAICEQLNTYSRQTGCHIALLKCVTR